MPGGYIPATDAGFDHWFANFNSVIQQHGPEYRVLAEEMAAIASAFQSWHAAYVRVTQPGDRTKAAVAAKDAARAAAESFVRPIAIRVKNDLGITNDQKVAIGVNPPNATRSPIPAPSSHPLLDVIGATPGTHTLRFSDSNSPASRSKPFGSVALQLWRAIAAAPVTDPSQASFISLITKQPFASTFDSVSNGKVATYFARWVTRTGLTGPWSPAVSYTVVS